MEILSGVEREKALEYFDMAADVALRSSCLRSRCGSVIVKDCKVIGTGYNSPPLDERIKKCYKDDLPENLSSCRTCCIHAEVRAIHDALKDNPDKIIGSRLHFMRLDEQGNKTKAGEPYCKGCSEKVLDVGVGEWVLWHEEGITLYGAKEYHLRSIEGAKRKALRKRNNL